MNLSISYRRLKNIGLIGLISFYGVLAHAELNIEIRKNIEKAVAIAVVPFGQNVKTPVDVAAIVKADLSRNGYFKTLAEEQMLTKPTTAAQVQFRAWQVLGQDYLLVGKIQPANDNYIVLFQLFGIAKKEQLMDYKITTSESGLRRAAHQISDLVYEKLSGKKGVFGTKVAFISSEIKADNRLYKLQVSDLDGFAMKTIVSTSEPIMSPTWSNDGTKIAYVSFENHRSAVFIQTLATGARVKIAAFSGINGAPAWSPDDSKLALTLSKEGNPNIYVVNIATKELTPVTKMTGINTEPTWSPDGQSIVFTSNAAGKPQLYQVASHGGTAQQLTFSGDYNAHASFSPDGQKIAMVHADNGDYKIAVLELATGTITILTSGNLDESPRFSTNGAMILYAARQGEKGVLAAVSADGKIQQKVEFQDNEVRDPAWMP